LKIAIKVVKNKALAIEINNKYENQQIIIWKIKKIEEISGKIVNFIVFFSDVCHFMLSDASDCLWSTQWCTTPL
jgi:hypothetical protein